MQKEPRRLLNSLTLAGCLLLITLIYATFFASKDIPFESWRNQITDWRGSSIRENVDKDILGEVDSQEFLLRRLVRGDDRTIFESERFSCHSDFHTDVCIADRQVRIDTKALKIYIPSSSNQSQAERLIKPYPLKEDANAMKTVTAVQILEGNITPPVCDFTHNVTAVIFSSGGFVGNMYHEFDEIILPLFLTCLHFQSRLKFIITDYQSWWVRKYNQILDKLSPYEAIDPAADGRVHCFPGAVIGLMYHGQLALNATEIPGGYSMFDFRKLLKESYNLKINSVSEVKKPVLVLLSRPKTRRFLNENKMVRLMEEMGFQVVVVLPDMMSNLGEFSRVVNSCSGIVAAHGAGLTNELFLPAGAVVVQVVPLGLEWASTTYYGMPASEMGLKYLEYKIEPEESSLINTYARDDPVFTDIPSIVAKGYSSFRAIYVDGQDLNINLTRFRESLVEASQILGLSAP
ncbi:hypothetical protein SLA2020_304810 [Shorea laevis]